MVTFSPAADVHTSVGAGAWAVGCSGHNRQALRGWHCLGVCAADVCAVPWGFWRHLGPRFINGGRKRDHFLFSYEQMSVFNFGRLKGHTFLLPKRECGPFNCVLCQMVWCAPVVSTRRLRQEDC